MTLEVFSCSWANTMECGGLCVCQEDGEFIICEHLLVKNVFKEE